MCCVCVLFHVVCQYIKGSLFNAFMTEKKSEITVTRAATRCIKVCPRQTDLSDGSDDFQLS